MKALFIHLGLPADKRAHLFMRNSRIGRFAISGIVSQRPCLSLLYLAGALMDAGAKVQYAEAECGSISISLKRYMTWKPDVVGLTSYSATWKCTQAAIGEIRALLPEAVIISGGSHAANIGERALDHENSPDIVFCGEAEESIREWADVFNDRNAWKHVSGIIYQDGDQIVRTLPRTAPVNLDALAFPAWRLVDLNNYRPAPNDYLRLPHASIIGSRGCRYSCIFCPSTTHYRRRSPENIVDEIEMLARDHGVRDLLFWDESILFDPEWTEALCREIMRRRLDVTWAANARVDQVSPETLKTMKQAGCWQLLFGLESGSQKSLDALGKGFALAQAEQAVAMSHRAGIRILGMFMFGIPGETMAEARKTIEFAARLPLNHASFVFFTPYPGSRIHEAIAHEDDGSLLRDAPFDMKEPSYVPAGMTLKQLQCLQAQAFRAFYLRPANIIKQIIGNMNRNKFGDGVRGLLLLLLSRRR
jgi:radical SAM superfamily enzyme YgiQ (UPF0313 family)